MRKIILDLDQEIDEDIYSEQYRDELVDNDEMSVEEDAFMRGYEEAG